MIRVVLVRIVKAFNEAVTDAARYCHRQVTLIEVETRLHHSVLDVVNYLLLNKPAFMAKIGAHKAPELGVHVLLGYTSRRQRSMMHIIHLLLVLELRLQHVINHL